MTMAVGFLSLPTELICHILILLNPRDISRCAMTCNTFCAVVRNSVGIQYKLELYTQGLISTETGAMHSNGISGKMLVTAATPPIPFQFVKCGLWWTDPGLTLELDTFYIQDCKTDPKLSQAWSTNDLFPQHWPPGCVAFDPLQDLMVVFSEPDCVTVTDAEQDHCIFLVEFRLASSQRPHPNAVCASLECKHTFGAPGYYRAGFTKSPIICGDRVFVFYYTYDTDDGADDLMSGIFIQVINWRKGYANSPGNLYHPVDGQKIVVVSYKGFIYLYTLQELDGAPQRRITYHLPKSCHDSSLIDILIHLHPSFHGKAARSELMPSYVPSLESQIMILEFLSFTRDAILVVDMAIFSDMALYSDMPVNVPWSDWGPQHVYYFPHDRNSRISVFGSKMAYALPQDRVPDPGQRLEGPSTESYFYVHIWDFNKRVTARLESINDPDSPDFFICKPARMTDSGEIFSNHAYTATVCRTPFPMRDSRMFLELDRLTLTWARDGEISIKVISPVQTEEKSVGLGDDDIWFSAFVFLLRLTVTPWSAGIA
ncbi:hypothetical protein F4604DRAFT_1951606 [Suillus subluteus]|nr:hypothetical protein F4604DRAFT_1951606 [Suillus subluteus]